MEVGPLARYVLGYLPRACPVEFKEPVDAC
jgi:hypothetical protein